jgi:transposase
MEKMKIAELLDKHFPMHGNWQGLSLGQIVTGWLAYILSEGDHRLNCVQDWVSSLLLTLSICWKAPDLRALDFSDDRLGTILTRLGDDTHWEAYETAQAQILLRVYDLKAVRVRIDSTTAKSYVGVSDDGLFQFGHSKEHRPDLPQLKINQSVLDPLGMPLTTTIVSGECADDPLYIPEIRKVQRILQQQGVLFVGDCKMAAQTTRAYLAASHDYYLCPLSAVQMPAYTLQDLLTPVWTGEQTLTPVYRPPEIANEQPELIAEGYTMTVSLRTEVEGKVIEWSEQRLIVRSLKHAQAQENALIARLEKAEQAIAGLNERGRGLKCRDEQDMISAVNSILERHNVIGLLIVNYTLDQKSINKRAYKERPAQTVITVTATVQTSRSAIAYENAVRIMGWRVCVCNDLDLGLTEAVLAYREQYIVERGFNRFRSKMLGLTPLYLSSTTRIKGLVRLLTIALRVLCLVEFEVRKNLMTQSEKLGNIYPGNSKRATSKPTTEMMLRSFRGIYLTVVNFNGSDHYCMTPLTAVQIRILALIGFSAETYLGLAPELGKLGIKMGEP